MDVDPSEHLRTTNTDYHHIYETILCTDLEPCPMDPTHMHILSNVCQCDFILNRTRLNAIINDLTLSGLKLDGLLIHILLADISVRSLKLQLSQLIKDLLYTKLTSVIRDSDLILQHAQAIGTFIEDNVRDYVDNYLAVTRHIVQYNISDPMKEYHEMNENYVKWLMEYLATPLPSDISTNTNSSSKSESEAWIMSCLPLIINPITKPMIVNIFNAFVKNLEETRVRDQTAYANVLDHFFVEDEMINEYFRVVLEQHLGPFRTILKNKIDSQALQLYAIQMGDRYQLDKVTSSYVDLYHTPTIRDYASSATIIKQSVNIKFKDYGLEVYVRGELKDAHDIFDCMIEYGVFDTRKTMGVILGNVIKTFSMEPNFMNKLDDATMCGMFDLISCANNSVMSLEEFIICLQTNYLLAADYHLEFILRIISRLYNVVIMMFTSDISVQNLIDNATESNPEMLVLYHYGFGYQFLLVPFGGKLQMYEASDRRKQIETLYGVDDMMVSTPTFSTSSTSSTSSVSSEREVFEI